jgi:hypothetical protein
VSMRQDGRGSRRARLLQGQTSDGFCDCGKAAHAEGYEGASESPQDRQDIMFCLLARRAVFDGDNFAQIGRGRRDIWRSRMRGRGIRGQKVAVIGADGRAGSSRLRPFLLARMSRGTRATEACLRPRCDHRNAPLILRRHGIRDSAGPTGRSGRCRVGSTGFAVAAGGAPRWLTDSLRIVVARRTERVGQMCRSRSKGPRTRALDAGGRRS